MTKASIRFCHRSTAAANLAVVACHAKPDGTFGWVSFRRRMSTFASALPPALAMAAASFGTWLLLRPASQPVARSPNEAVSTKLQPESQPPEETEQDYDVACLVCCSSAGVLLHDACQCSSVIHLECLREMRRQTPAHAERCAVCLSPYDTRSGLTLWEKHGDSVGGLTGLVPQLVLLLWGTLARCPVCKILLALELCALLSVCLYSYAFRPARPSGESGTPRDSRQRSWLASVRYQVFARARRSSR